VVDPVTTVASRRRRLVRPLLTWLVVVLTLVAGTVGGATLALRAFGESTAHLALGTVTISVDASTSGRAELYMPLVDWEVVARPFRAPVTVRAEVTSVDREQALVALRSGADANRKVEEARAQVPPLVRDAVRHALLVAGLGGLIGAVLAGCVLAVAFGRRRLAVFSLPAGLLASAALVVPVGWSLTHVDYRAFQHPTFHAHGAELPRLLAFSAQLTDASKGYTTSYETALIGLVNLVSLVENPVTPPTAVHEFVVGSDIHSNTLPLRAFGRYATGKPIFLVGDFSQLGTSYEVSIADDIAALGPTVVTVSGNHDSAPLMRRLAERGVTVLRNDGALDRRGQVVRGPVITVAGMTVAGFSDPLEAPAATFGVHPLELQGNDFKSAGQRLVEWFDELRPRPQVVLVHQHGLAHALLDHVAAQQDHTPVVILTGHDHLQHMERVGKSLLVDGGTLGAGGLFAVGEIPAGFIDLRLDASFAPISADMVQIEPVSGDGSARRVVFDPQDTHPRARWDPVPPAADPAKPGEGGAAASAGDRLGTILAAHG
jgi:predicted phosphodiesterase